MFDVWPAVIADVLSIFFFNAPPPTDIYTLSLHDALPIYLALRHPEDRHDGGHRPVSRPNFLVYRSEEHTSELQSHSDLVCRLLLEKKNTSPIPATCWTTPGPHDRATTGPGRLRGRQRTGT